MMLLWIYSSSQTVNVEGTGDEVLEEQNSGGNTFTICGATAANNATYSEETGGDSYKFAANFGQDTINISLSQRHRGDLFRRRRDGSESMAHAGG